LGTVQGRRVLDFGSGSGHKLFFLGYAGAHATAVEIDPQQIKNIRTSSERLSIPVELVEGGTERLYEFPDGAFDRVLLSEVIEHIPVDQVGLFCSNIARIMKPGGRLFLTTPNFTFYGPAENSKEYYQRQPYGHHKHYTQEELRNLLKPFFHIRCIYYETHPKTLSRNQIFYPLARLDYAIRYSRRYPLLSLLLRPFFAILYYLSEWFYPLQRKIHHKYENEHSDDEMTGLTIMVDCERL